MRSQVLAILRIILLVFVMNPAVSIFFPVKEAEAQQTPFLITPYFGSEGVNSWFDHEFPTYYFAPNGTGVLDSENEIFTRYDGARWVNLNKNDCQIPVGNCYDGHDGIDFSLAYERVLASANGTVSLVGWYGNDLATGCHNGAACGYGLYIEITHANGYITRYGHLSAAAVSSGQYVYAGQIIGTSGDTGNSSGPHLHFGVRRVDNGRAVDPFGWTGAGNDPWAVYASGATSWFMWSGGQWVGSPISAPAETGTIITVDDTTNNTGGFDKGSGGPFNNICQGNCGGWTGAAIGYGGDMHHTIVNGTVANSWARWQTTIPKPGIYEVEVYVPSNNATTYQAQYTIQQPAGQGQRIAFGVDQYGLSNQWVTLGAYHFLSGTASVWVTDATGEQASTNRLVGVDAIRLKQQVAYPLYVPDIRQGSGWVSLVVVRNNSGNTLLLNPAFLTANGSYTCGGNQISLAPNATWNYWVSCGTPATSAVIDADRDISATVIRYRTTPYVAAAYTGISTVASTVRLPLVHRNNSGWYSDIMVMNAGASSTTATVYFHSSGGDICPQSFALQPNGSVSLGTTSVTCLGSGYYNGARIVSSNGMPLAVVTTQFKDYTGDGAIDSLQDYEGFPSTLSTNYWPLLQRNNSYWEAGIMLQNPNPYDITVSNDYYYRASQGGGYCCGSSHFVPANRAVAVFPLPVPTSPAFVGSGKGTAGGPFLSIVNQLKSISGDYTATSYSAVGGGTSAAVVPLALKNYNNWNGLNGWYTGVNVQNVGASTASVTINYYWSSGAWAGSNSASVPPNAPMTFFPANTPDGFIGSAWVSANQPIAVAVNFLASAGTADAQMSHGGINR